MRKKNKNEKPSALVWVLSLIMAVMFFVTGIACAVTIGKLRDAYRRDFGLVNYYAEQGNYGQMIHEFRQRHFDVDPFDSPYEEAYYTADYADAAFQYKYFRDAGNEEMTRRLERRMEAARTGAGSLAPMADRIDAILAELPKHK